MMGDAGRMFFADAGIRPPSILLDVEHGVASQDRGLGARFHASLPFFLGDVGAEKTQRLDR